MISLTRLNGQAILVNESNILWVEALPDTSVTLLNGERLLVRESVQDVCDRVNRRSHALLSGVDSRSDSVLPTEFREDSSILRSGGCGGSGSGGK
jgi:uncharacterized protein YlzI (FlbEa/FlbD family)